MKANRRGPRFTATVAAGALALAGTTLAFAGAASGAQAAPAANQHAYSFATLDNASDPTFNQLLGINNKGTIAGYFGSGAAGPPEQGLPADPAATGSGNYANENFPGSVQTQVTGLNDKGVTVGFWSSMNNASMVNDNSGFYELTGGQFHTAELPDRHAGQLRRSTSCSASTTATSRSASGPTRRATTTATGQRQHRQVQLGDRPERAGGQPDRRRDQQRAATSPASTPTRPTGPPTASSRRAARSPTWPCPARRPPRRSA